MERKNGQIKMEINNLGLMAYLYPKSILSVFNILFNTTGQKKRRNSVIDVSIYKVMYCSCKCLGQRVTDLSHSNPDVC